MCKRLIGLFLVIFLFAGCDGDDGVQPNQASMVNAGPDQTVALAVGQTTVDVTLDGTGSSDPDRTIVTFTWTGTPDPNDVATPTVTLGAGVHTFTLVVTDDDGATSQPDTVVITVQEIVAIGNATLLGENEVPPADPAAGAATIVLLNAPRLAFTVVVDNPDATDITRIHIHRGAAGVNGPIVVTLCDDNVEEQPTCASRLEGNAFQGLVDLTEAEVADLLTDDFYVNAHTAAFPGGALRGQVDFG